MSLSKNRIKKCNKGIHVYGKAENKTAFTKLGLVNIVFKRCIYCNKRLN